MRRATMWRRCPALAIWLGASLALPELAAAQALPQFNTRPGCASRGANAAQDVQTCLEDEGRAREQLAKDWTAYAASDRANCTLAARSGGIQSYIELLVCLQIAKDARTGNSYGETIASPRR